MARFKKLPINENVGKISYGLGIVDNIVILALREIPYIKIYSPSKSDKLRNNSINVYADKDGVNVDVAIKIYYTQSISETSFKIQEAIRHNIEAMTEYRVASVNVSILGVMFDDEIEIPVDVAKDKDATVEENLNQTK